MVWKPSTPWTANSTIPYADQSYQNGDRPAGGSFSPAILRTFDGGTVGQSAQAEFDDGGANGIYANDHMLNGSTYLDSTAAASNANTFGFGGWLNMPRNLVVGDEFWAQVTIYPDDAFYGDSNPHLKFLRLREETALGVNSGYNDVYMNTDGTIKYIKEGPAIWQYAKSNGIPRPGPADLGTPTTNAWNKYEFYIKLSTSDVDGLIRVWQDNALILEASVQTMNNSDGYCNQFLLFTYWNGEPTLPSTPRTVGIENLIIATNDDPPPNTDASGNVFIGSWTP